MFFEDIIREIRLYQKGHCIRVFSRLHMHFTQAAKKPEVIEGDFRHEFL